MRPTTGLSDEMTDTEHQEKEESEGEGEKMEETITPLHIKRSALGGAILRGGQGVEVEDPKGQLVPHPQ